MSERVRLIDDPVLRKRCEQINVLDAAFIQGLLDTMHDTMKAENGMGLAANQIGHSVRVFILKKTEGYDEFINPEILSQEELVDFEGEGCLSIPGASGTTRRYRKLRLKWQDKHGTTKEDNFEDVKAFAVQHEMDHLNGKLYVDQLSTLKRSMILGKHRKYLRELGRQ